MVVCIIAYALDDDAGQIIPDSSPLHFESNDTFYFRKFLTVLPRFHHSIGGCDGSNVDNWVDSVLVESAATGDIFRSPSAVVVFGRYLSITEVVVWIAVNIFPLGVVSVSMIIRSLVENVVFSTRVPPRGILRLKSPDMMLCVLMKLIMYLICFETRENGSDFAIWPS